MKTHMFSNISKQLQILNSIVIFFPINMMNSFFWHKVSTQILFHYKSMFKNIIIIYIFIRMLWGKNKNISSRVFSSSTFIYWRSISSFMSPSTSFRTIRTYTDFFKFTFIYVKIFVTKFTYLFYFGNSFSSHIVLPLKRAAFGGLSKTVKFSHLLTAQVLDIINPPSISNYIITQMEGM